MELLVASAVGLMTAAGVYLILRRAAFPVILGLAMLSYAVNVFIFASGRLAIGLPPMLLKGGHGYTDPLTQALVLTAIVISFGDDGGDRADGAWRLSGNRIDDRIDMTDDEGQRGEPLDHRPRRAARRSGPADRAGHAPRPDACSGSFHWPEPPRWSLIGAGLLPPCLGKPARGLSPWQLARAFRHRAGAGPAVGADGGADGRAGACWSSFTPSARAGMRAAGISTRCSSSS